MYYIIQKDKNINEFEINKVYEILEIPNEILDPLLSARNKPITDKIKELQKNKFTRNDINRLNIFEDLCIIKDDISTQTVTNLGIF